MNRTIALLALALLLTSCSSDTDIGRRYRAERAFWQASWEQQNLGIRPEEVARERWESLAERFEAIGREYASVPDTAHASQAEQQIRAIAARAFFTAAQIRDGIGDSARVDEIHQHLARNFDDLPEVAAEIAMARGMLAERRRQLDRAAGFYERIIDRVAPDPEGAGAETVVLNLPLRIARLRSTAAPEERSADDYATARSYYERILADEETGPVLRVETLARLAELATDLEAWDETLDRLRTIESELRAMEEPLREPCDVRYAIAGIQRRSGADPDTVRATLAGILRDYPDCSQAPQILLNLAQTAASLERIDEALGYLDRVVDEHGEDVTIGSQALLASARLLESRGRWPEALEAYRSIPVQYPLSEPALMAPLEIAAHHNRAGDAEAAEAALARAAEEYRRFIDRYPPGPMTAMARERLAQTLALQQEFDQAIDEMISLGDEFAQTPRGAMLLITAGRMAAAELADTARAVAIFEHIGEIYADTDIGRQALQEAEILRGSTMQ
ncbi:MAG: tetratricopeptide repeat protein [Candidatus Eisenbacteria bacterium]|nr:tetratricopeptide repeat protein [Candidatus Eisenbacteria bacterium]